MLYDIKADFSKIETIYPYDTNSLVYQWYTGEISPYIIPDHPAVKKIGDALFAESDNLLDYARRAYEYVAANFSYLKPLTGLHPLEDILANRGGDCGNLSSVYVSLLRYKGIPARHLVAVKPRGFLHAWTDFYLEGYGWIPVDVTLKQEDPEGDYFGRVRQEDNGIIVMHRINPALQITDDVRLEVPLLQRFGYFYFSGEGGLGASYRLISLNEAADDG